MSNAPIIQGNFETLEQVAKRFGQQSERITQMHRLITRAVGRLRGGGWEGVGADAFLAEMESVAFPAIQRLTAALQQARHTTLQIRNALHTSESEAAALFRDEGSRGSPFPFDLGTLAGTTPLNTPVDVPTPPPTETGTPTAPPPPLPNAVYAEEYTIPNLAALQENQGQTNNCGEYAAAAALDILLGQNRFTGTDLTTFANESTNLLPGLGRRMYPSGPTMPQQQANLINDYAAANNLPVEATATTTTRDGLIRMLDQPDQTLMVTITWGNDWQPTLTSNGSTYNVPPSDVLPYTGHVMVLAAYEDNGGNPRWGFVNSWADGTTNDIFWMTDADFQRAWGYGGVLMGSNNVVVVRDTTNDPAPVPPSPTPEPEPNPVPILDTTIPVETGTPVPVTP